MKAYKLKKIKAAVFQISSIVNGKISLLFISLFTTSCFAQNAKVITPDLTKLVRQNKITAFNRSVTILSDSQNKNGIHLDANDNYGVAWLNDIRFGNGTLEFDIKGKNTMQQSFVGIAFHGLDNNTLDAIYFRPFNFQAQDVEKKNHSAQYISLPSYDWQKLRTDFPNKYEHALNPSPLPDEWFHVRVVINIPKISVYVNNNSTPDLVVEQLSNRKDGNIGFWVGNQSDGDFANLKITLQ
ncbi:MAG: family 16 glycoside hydrolase [Ferruginibacter sp.]